MPTWLSNPETEHQEVELLEPGAILRGCGEGPRGGRSQAQEPKAHAWVWGVAIHFPLCIFGRIEGPLESQFPHWLNGENNPYFEGSCEDLVG